MNTSGTWYPPSLGTGGFLLTNPPFAPMTDDISITLRERAQRYGKFIGHAEITVNLKKEIGRAMVNSGCCLQPDQLEALHMIAHKIGQIGRAHV